MKKSEISRLSSHSRYLEKLALNFLPFISNSDKQAHFPCIFRETRVTCYIQLLGKQKYQVTNIGMKSKIVTFATSMYY